MWDMTILLLTLAYLIAVLGSIAFFCWVRIRNLRKKRKPKLRLIKNDEDR